MGKVFNPKFFKQYPYADFFEISKNERSVWIVFCLVSSCKEANAFCFVRWYKKANLLPIIDLTLQKWSNVCWCYFIECVSWYYFIGWTSCVLLVIWILYCWSFVPLVSYSPYLITKRMHLIQKIFFKKWYLPKTLQLLSVRTYQIKFPLPLPGH